MKGGGREFMHNNAITTRNKQEGWGWGVGEEEGENTGENGGGRSREIKTLEKRVVVQNAYLGSIATGWRQQKKDKGSL